MGGQYKVKEGFNKNEDKMNTGMKLMTIRHGMRPCVVVEMNCKLALSPLASRPCGSMGFL